MRHLHYWGTEVTVPLQVSELYPARLRYIDREMSVVAPELDDIEVYKPVYHPFRVKPVIINQWVSNTALSQNHAKRW